jgi:hypothetical protein
VTIVSLVIFATKLCSNGFLLASLYDVYDKIVSYVKPSKKYIIFFIDVHIIE